MGNKYQVEENADGFSFKPFYQYRSRSIWYMLTILVLTGSALYFYDQYNESLLIISIALLVVIGAKFLKEILFQIPVGYTFDGRTKEVYQSSIWGAKKKIMNLDELTIYRSSEDGIWQYKMGKKKSQFVKSYAISEHFSNKKNNTKPAIFEEEILDRIEELLNTDDSQIPANAGNSSFNPIR